jgi:catechol 2,3-dioxygenase-like lactoylglutathione lyase family enzyme
MSEVQVEQKTRHVPPKDGISIAHFLIVSDIERSLRFYETVFGGSILSRPDGKGAPGYLQLANTWLILDGGGGPTHDKPTVTWRNRGANFITEPKPRSGEMRCYVRDPDGYIIEVGQSNPGVAYG